MNICIIPARAGSKRIPGKNTRDFCGSPMLVRAITTAVRSELFQGRIYVSSEDRIETRRMAQYAGVQWLARPPELADDNSTTLELMQDAVRTLLAPADVELGNDLDVCCLYPCTPFLEPGTLVQAKKLLETSGRHYVVPVTEFKPQRALRIEGQAPVSVWPQFADVRTQDLEPRYRDAGQFYFGRAMAWLGAVPIYGNGSYAMLLPQAQAIDIDTEDDWKMAEALMRGRP
jgi:pseudaminic acid cytidylyltransferase